VALKGRADVYFIVTVSDDWLGTVYELDTMAGSKAKAVSNVRYRVAAKRGIRVFALEPNLYRFTARRA
jgi:hypothetical protein